MCWNLVQSLVQSVCHWIFSQLETKSLVWSFFINDSVHPFLFIFCYWSFMIWLIASTDSSSSFLIYWWKSISLWDSWVSSDNFSNSRGSFSLSGPSRSSSIPDVSVWFSVYPVQRALLALFLNGASTFKGNAGPPLSLPSLILQGEFPIDDQSSLMGSRH